jgi:hypothetical protein
MQRYLELDYDISVLASSDYVGSGSRTASWTATSNGWFAVIVAFNQTPPKTQANAPRSTGVDSSGLVGYWSFNGTDTNWTSATAGTVYDRSGFGYNGTMHSMKRDSSPVDGISGQALLFDGNTSYIDTADVDITDTITVSAWINPSISITSSFGYLGIINKGRVTAWAFGHGGGNNDLDVRFNNSEVAATANNVYSPNVWAHVAFTYDKNAGSNQVIIYVNGVQKATGTYSTAIGTNSNKIAIGVEQDGGDYWPGAIDEIRIYSRALSPSEIQQLYQAGASRMAVNTKSSAAPDSSGLVGYWPFNGQDTNWTSATGGTAYDRSGAGNNATITNMSRDNSPIDGISGQAFSFDGNNNLVRDTAINLSGTNAASVSFWMYLPAAFTTERVVFDNSDDCTSNNGFCFFAGGPDCLTQFEVGYSDGSSNYNTKCYTPISYRVWHHYVAVFDRSQAEANEVKLYTDGALTTEASHLFTYDGSTNWGNVSFNIGERPDGNYPINAKIDEFRIYSRALSASEIKNLYQAGLRRAKPTN